ncbi:MAG: tetratricopeptide repeat protein, partial [Kiritimatiellae bacterium]|nr:tetratricopeptide repeat protein [Kiritimatiellia bacterium]
MVVFGCAALALSSLAPLRAVADDAEAPAAAPAAAGVEELDPALKLEISYVEKLIEYGFPDFAEPVIAATKKKWPEAETQFFAIEIRGMLSLGKFDEAEAKIAALPDRTGAKYWAARLEVANNLFFRGKKAECSKIYDEFFRAFPQPTKEIREFYMQACYAWGQILVGDKRFEEAVKVYAGLLSQINKQKSEDDANTWCNVACETAEMYLKLATDQPDVRRRAQYLDPAKKIVDELLWEQDRPVYFGRAIAMKANIELLKGDIAKAQQTINEYMPQLELLHQQIVDFDPEGKEGLRRFSPMPLCRFMLAKMLWDEAQEEYKKPKRDDERVKALLFGEKTGAGGRRNGLGAFNHAINVFIQYPESTWAPDAGEMSEKIKAFAEKNYGAKIQAKITAEQLAKVRQMQFRTPAEKMAEDKTEEAIADYLEVLGRYPEVKESVYAIEEVARGYLNLIAADKENAKVPDWRIDADAVEGYLAERFAGVRSREIMTLAGESVLRLAAMEKQRGQLARADRLYQAFLTNYRQHVSAATTASTMLGEAMGGERWADAIKLCRLIQRYYTNSIYYASSYSQESYCHTKLDEPAEAIASMKAYVEVEKDGIMKEQARMALAQMYQKKGFDILADAETNDTPAAVEAALKAGSAQIVRGIKEFRAFADKADKALADPSLTKADKARYSLLKEQALFLVGDCWRRMTKPERMLETFRKNAAASYETYLDAYPEGRYSTNAYVRLGTIYTALGDLEKSKDALDRLARMFPDSLEAKNSKPQLAKSLIEMGLRKEGTEIYAEMLQTDGAYTAGQFVNAGEALIEAKSWDLANEAFEKAVHKAGTNSYQTVARARVGQAKALYKRKAYVEARDALDHFLDDERMSRMAIAVDATRLLIEVASEQGRTEKDTALRGKHFGKAIGAVKRLRNYWKNKPQWEQDSVTLMSAEVKLRQMAAEENMGLKDEAIESGKSAASTLLAFLQSHCVDEGHPADKMAAGELANLERCYSMLVPLYAKLGADKADSVMKYGQEFLDLFPNGKARTAIQNAMNQAKVEGGSA